MIKFWSIKRSKNIDIIVINDESIFKGKIKHEELNHFSKQIENSKIPDNLFEIPFSYIKRIQNQKSENEIKVYFGNDSEEELECKKAEVKNEIFNYCKEKIPKMVYSKGIPSLIKYAKPQLFAILFTVGVFLWSLYYAIQIENGVEYDLQGRAGIGAIIYSIGLLGVLKVVLLFSILIGIAVYSLLRKLKTRTEVEELNRF